MQVALVGMIQSGKSELFTAVAEGHASGEGGGHQVAHAMVKVPDERLGVLIEMYKPKKTTQATIEFLDLPGLNFIDEANRQEARRTIAHARQADMLVFVVRGFENASVMAYRERVDPVADFEELQSEILLADLELISNRIEKLKVNVTKPTKTQDQDKRELALLTRCSEAVEEMQPLSSVISSPEEEKLLRSFGFLTLKPTRVALNVSEGETDSADTEAARTKLQELSGGDVMVLTAPLEAELAALDAEEREAFLEDMGVSEVVHDRLINICYGAVHLISFLTVGPDEVRAWSIPAECHAVDAAGEIHSDIQRGFIRAETVSYDDLTAAGDMKAAKAAGKVRLEGKTYCVQDGDIINFRFNV